MGNLVSETDALGNETTYEYDANGRVTTITDALGQSAELAYDAAGNIQAGDLMYFGEIDAEGNTVIHHATIISKVDSTSIFYAGNTNSRFDYPLIRSFISPDNEMVFIVQVP